MMGGSSGLPPPGIVSPEQEETSHFMGSEWTDEKHVLYLKHMEATFVNQLYKSMDVFGLKLRKNYPSQATLSKCKQHRASSPCGQFKVFQDGRWSKVDFKNGHGEAGLEEEPGVLLENPWIQHYKFSERKFVVKSPYNQKKFPSARLVTSDSNFPIHHTEIGCQGSLGSYTEVTDQNFNDEELEEEMSAMLHDSKRVKTSIDATLHLPPR